MFRNIILEGPLSNYPNMFKGNLIGALKAIRPLIDGVTQLHKHEKKYVHRDIKPQNILVSSNGELILGDFGLIINEADDYSRPTDSYENVGSRDWMPAWATGKIEDIKPTFDVYTIGKVLWSMVSGKSYLRNHYFNDSVYPEMNLLEIFPDKPEMLIANELFSKCVIEYEKYCLPSATELLAEVNKYISILDRGGSLLNTNMKRFCLVCGVGEYLLYTGKNHKHHKQPVGFDPIIHGEPLNEFTCSYCGHIQLFNLNYGSKVWDT